MRQAVKSIFVKEIAERNMTAVIASHNLRELEDICDHIGLLHKGGVLLSKDLYDVKLSIQRAQCVFTKEEDQEAAFEGLEIIKTERRGNLITVTVRVTQEELVSRLKKVEPVYYEVLPLTLEELFISETEVVGYDIKKLIY
jgi:ABC-2 type transport system ATP-binding protein